MAMGGGRSNTSNAESALYGGEFDAPAMEWESNPTLGGPGRKSYVVGNPLGPKTGGGEASSSSSASASIKARSKSKVEMNPLSGGGSSEAAGVEMSAMGSDCKVSNPLARKEIRDLADDNGDDEK